MKIKKILDSQNNKYYSSTFYINVIEKLSSWSWTLAQYIQRSVIKLNRNWILIKINIISNILYKCVTKVSYFNVLLAFNTVLNVQYNIYANLNREFGMSLSNNFISISRRRFRPFRVESKFFRFFGKTIR